MARISTNKKRSNFGALYPVGTTQKNIDERRALGIVHLVILDIYIYIYILKI